MMVLAAYMTRGLQLVLGATKRSEIVGRGDDISRRGHDEMPLHQRRADSDDIASPPQLRLQQHHYSQSSTAESSSSSLPDYPAQAPPPPARCALYAARLASHLDASIFALVLLAGIPVYYASGYAMPLHLAVTTLCYRLALATPGPWQRYLHPVLTASLLAVLVIWPLSLAHGSGLAAALRSYKTGANYTRLWRREPGPPLLPGAGDVFSTVLDASIVSLALPMFQYRRELKRHLATLAIPNVLISVGSVLSYPPICRAIGIAPTRSLAFASRSLTLALATPATANLGGDAHTVAALAIASGILGVLVADKMMRLLRIPDDDYVTRGITLGVNSSAIGTALLLRTDPRAAALSSLSMTLFGTVTVLLTSIPPVATMIRALVGFASKSARISALLLGSAADPSPLTFRPSALGLLPRCRGGGGGGGTVSRDLFSEETRRLGASTPVTLGGRRVEGWRVGGGGGAIKGLLGVGESWEDRAVSWTWSVEEAMLEDDVLGEEELLCLGARYGRRGGGGAGA
ncbi:Plastidal glycolate/glycerate translocator 1, chloroplastic [Metarhizium anisopliae]|nr:Plastidal glycolate/glycerate translocator 1, chloroplastic [Metarhizium anisopliae]